GAHLNRPAGRRAAGPRARRGVRAGDRAARAGEARPPHRRAHRGGGPEDGPGAAGGGVLRHPPRPPGGAGLDDDRARGLTPAPPGTSDLRRDLALGLLGPGLLLALAGHAPARAADALDALERALP